ncbi:MAG: ribbon-helix-helix domain-containing protein [Pseudomonadota bacterium]
MLDKTDVTLTIRLPEHLSNELNRAARDLDQTRGELIRRALRHYLATGMVDTPSGQDVA